MNRISLPIKGASEIFLTPFHHVRLQTAVCEPGSGSSPDTGPTGATILNFQTPEPWDLIFIVQAPSL